MDLTILQKCPFHNYLITFLVFKHLKNINESNSNIQVSNEN